MTQIRYAIRQQNMNLKAKARLSHINVYQYNKSTSDITPGHPYMKIIYILSGSGTFRIQDEVCHVQENDFILMNPSRKRFSVQVGSPVHFVVFGVENLVIEPPDASNSLNMYRYRPKKNSYDRIVNDILGELTSMQTQYEYACSYYLQLLLIELEREGQCSFRSPIKEKKSKDCKFIKDYLDEHFMENLSLDVLSEQSNMNKYYLVHSFTKAFGCSPINYLNEKRIEESKRLLETTDYSIADIAIITGFSSQSYFSQAFKKNTFMTPNEYRRSTKM